MKLVMYRNVPFLIPPPGEKQNSRDVGMSYWWHESLKSALSYTEQLWHIHSFIRANNLRTLEMFAGLGVSTAPLRSKLSTHVGADHDPECLSAFKCLHEFASACCIDTYTELGDIKGAYDYVLAEYNALTTYRALTDKKERQLFDKLFAAEAQYVAYVDCAKVKQHLHYEKYSEFFEAPVYDSESYILAVRNFIIRNFKYWMKAATYDFMNYTFLFENRPTELECIKDVRSEVNLKLYKEICDVDV